MSYTRREFVKRAALVGAGLALPFKLTTPSANAQGLPPAQTPLPGSAIPQFVDPLPGTDIIDTITNPREEIALEMREFGASLLPTGTFTPGVVPKTTVWGYLQVGQTERHTHLGPIIINKRGTPTQMRFVNKLGDTTSSNLLAWIRSTDQTLAWADPINDEANACATEALQNPGKQPTGACAQNYAGPIPACVHLHGGEVPAWLDGGPDAWYTSDGLHQGHAYYTHPGVLANPNEAVYRYPNTQEAAPIWFHDHTLGATRLNVYAGLAGGYIIADPDNDPDLGLGPIPLIIQDRMFDTNGQLFFPAGVPYIPNPDHPFWVPEFLGDVILVNGKAWPFLNVEPKRYRFLFVNGSNARTYEMFLTNQATGLNGPAMWQIATDGGYLDAPVKIDPNALKPAMSKLVLMPGERADVIIDFNGLPAGTQLLMRNIARAPYPNGATPNGKTTGRIMQFRVIAQTAPDGSYNPALGGALRKTPMVRLVNPATGTVAAGVTVQKKRQLTLNEVMGLPITAGGIAYPGGPLEILVNNTKYMGESPRNAPGGLNDFTPLDVNGNITWYSELPEEGATEQWEIINLTADSHPIHFHLTQVQLLNRQNFDLRKYNTAYAAAYGGMVLDGFGPPLNYNAANADGAVGGNPALTPFLKGAPMPPNANEAGWKDTINMLPGQVTRVLVRYAPTDLPATTPQAGAYYPFDPNHGHGYVVHCHIVDHEDNEMMRPLSVLPNPNAADKRTYEPGKDY
jgi:FtsP/CotA-like multicopper oxidase with cupredoxin domain